MRIDRQAVLLAEKFIARTCTNTGFRDLPNTVRAIAIVKTVPVRQPGSGILDRSSFIWAAASSALCAEPRDVLGARE